MRLVAALASIIIIRYARYLAIARAARFLRAIVRGRHVKTSLTFFTPNSEKSFHVKILKKKKGVKNFDCLDSATDRREYNNIHMLHSFSSAPPSKRAAALPFVS